MYVLCLQNVGQLVARVAAVESKLSLLEARPVEGAPDTIVPDISTEREAAENILARLTLLENSLRLVNSQVSDKQRHL